MQIDFYEEFPTKDNLKKLKLIKFKSGAFIAAKSLNEFNKIAKQAKRINKNLNYAYWPIIENSYWISPFSDATDLTKLFSELNKTKNVILIDLELPLNIKSIIKNLFFFRKNKKLIKKFLGKNRARIITAQYPPCQLSRIMRLLGVDYDIKTKKSLMFYTSIIPKFMVKNIKGYLINLKEKRDYFISLGIIGHGILGKMPQLSAEDLEKELNFVKENGFNKVIIFGLNGLNKEYIKVINKFI